MKHLLIIWDEANGPCVLSLAGYVLGITMMVTIIAIGAGIILGYTYKRSVASLLGSLRGRGEGTQSQTTLLWVITQKESEERGNTSSRCRDLVLVFTRRP